MKPIEKGYKEEENRRNINKAHDIQRNGAIKEKPSKYTK